MECSFNVCIHYSPCDNVNTMNQPRNIVCVETHYNLQLMPTTKRQDSREYESGQMNNTISNLLLTHLFSFCIMVVSTV